MNREINGSWALERSNRRWRSTILWSTPISTCWSWVTVFVFSQQPKWPCDLSNPAHLSPWQKKDGVFTGFIKVHFQLVRPVSLPPAQSCCSTPEEAHQTRRRSRRTSFYLPKDTAKHLHISCRTRVLEVIEALLKKFMVVDSPAKFALFERTERQSQGLCGFMKLNFLLFV